MRARPRRRTRDGLPETAPPRKWETIASAAPISARASGHLSRRCPRLVASRSLSPADAASTAAPSSSGGGSSPRAQARDRAISQRAWPRMVSSVLDSHFTGCSISRCSRSRSARRASSVPNRSGQAEGSSTSCANSTARHAANGRRAHHRCKVEGWPCRILFSRADALLMASSGRETSISFLRIVTAFPRDVQAAAPRSSSRSSRSSRWWLTNKVRIVISETWKCAAASCCASAE